MVEAALRIPASAMARFTDAEARLYPIAMVDPDGYERATTLVGLVVAELRRSGSDIESVLSRRDELIGLLPTIAHGAGAGLGNLPPDAVVDAASAVRCRELQAAGTAAAVQARITAARSAGEEWVVDEPDPAQVMAGSYRRVELHLPTDSTLIASIEAGVPGEMTAYTLELVPGNESVSRQTWRYPDRDAWQAAVEQLRADISAGR
jgi:hypothetical protein